MRVRWCAGVAGLLAVVAAALVACGSSADAPPRCSGAAAAQPDCYAEIARTAGVRQSVDALKAAHAVDARVRRTCHGLVHVIGRVAGERHGTVAGAFAEGDPFCGSGYYHGAMEAVVAGRGLDGALADPDALCADLGGHPQRSAYHRNCAHGLGHAFMGVVDHQPPAALAGCDRLSDAWEADHCADGVFMQHVMDAADHDEHQAAPFALCEAVADRHKARCYERQTGRALQVGGGDVAAVFAQCAQVEPAHRVSCHRGIGRDVAGVGVLTDPDDAARTAETARLCALGPDEASDADCVAGAAQHLVRHFHRDQQALALCAAVEPALRAGCTITVQTYAEAFEDTDHDNH